MRTLSSVLIWAAACVCGCRPVPQSLYPIQNEGGEPPALGEAFAPQTCGELRGKVRWHGPLPRPDAFAQARIAIGSEAEYLDRFHPAFPAISGADQAIGSAIVFLRRVDPRASRPWDLPPVRVVGKDNLIHIDQGGICKTGIVRQGDAVQFVSENNVLEIIRADGAAFFTLPFPDTRLSVSRRMQSPGVVELSSGLGHLLARSWLMVVEHPYFCRSDDAGCFCLPQVPEGDYELVCWHPDWRITRFERDPENLYVSRIAFRPPVEKSVQVKVLRGQCASIEIDLSLADFGATP